MKVITDSAHINNVRFLIQLARIHHAHDLSQRSLDVLADQALDSLVRD